jgi:hypothetical protein
VAKPVEPPHNPVAPVDIDATDTGVLDI